MQADNIVVIYDNAANNSTVGSAAGKAVWASNTSGKGTAGQANLNMQPDGNLDLYSCSSVLWASNPSGR